jgi:23S rRNA (adenine2030-N6)-methyltransferase
VNYRHAFHAGNFADVHKHVIQTLILCHLREKPAAFRVLDTHAGAGEYDLAGTEAARTGEWRDGIGRLLTASLPADAAALLEPYLSAVRSRNPDGAVARYPGSPAITLAFLRAQDRLIAVELEPGAAGALRALLGRERRAKAVTMDGWTALSAFIPPKERRGLVLIDPPFEQAGEFGRMFEALVLAHRKWPTGIFALWYPVKDRGETARFTDLLAGSSIPKVLQGELQVAPIVDGAGLGGSGVIVVNPPWRLHEQLQIVLPALSEALSRGGNGWRVTPLSAER